MVLTVIWGRAEDGHAYMSSTHAGEDSSEYVYAPQRPILRLNPPCREVLN